jgi:hypothetical protein
VPARPLRHSTLVVSIARIGSLTSALETRYGYTTSQAHGIATDRWAIVACTKAWGQLSETPMALRETRLTCNPIAAVTSKADVPAQPVQLAAQLGGIDEDLHEAVNEPIAQPALDDFGAPGT